MSKNFVSLANGYICLETLLEIEIEKEKSIYVPEIISGIEWLSCAPLFVRSF